MDTVETGELAEDTSSGDSVIVTSLVSAIVMLLAVFYY